MGLVLRSAGGVGQFVDLVAQVGVKLFEFFDVDGDGSVEYTEFAYQFYNRSRVSDRMRSKSTGGRYQRHGHIRGKVAKDTGELLFDLDFTDNMTGDKPLTRSEVAMLRNRLRQYVSFEPVFFYSLLLFCFYVLFSHPSCNDSSSKH